MPSIRLEVHGLGGESIHDLEVDAHQTPEALMSELEDCTAVPAEFQRLLFRDHVLTSNLSLWEQGVTENTTLLCIMVVPDEERLEVELSVSAGSAFVVRYLLRSRADPMQPLRCGMLPLEAAMRSGKMKCVAALLEARADPDRGSGRSFPLQAAARGDHLEATLVLLTARANPLQADSEGRTGLHTAARWGHEGCLRALVATGIDLHHGDFYEWSALHSAAYAGSAACVKVLLEARADPWQSDKDGYAPLYWAHRRRHYACAKLLEEAQRGERASCIGCYASYRCCCPLL